VPYLLQCDTCKDTALGIPTVHHPNGEPIFIGRVPSRVVAIKCHRCKHTAQYAPTQIVRMRKVTASDLEALGFPKEVLY
jgi:hypothetical protein